MDNVFSKHHLYEDDLFEAANNGCEAKCIFLIDFHKVGVDSRDQENRTALQISARAGHVQVAKLLIDRGAYVGSANFKGMTALHWAAFYGNCALIELLLDRGKADIEQTNRAGFTALQYAAYGNRETALVLLQRGARIRGGSVAPKRHQPVKYNYVKLCSDWQRARLLWTLCATRDVRRCSSSSPLQRLPKELFRVLGQFL